MKDNELSVKVGVDTSELEKGMKKSGDLVKDFGKEAENTSSSTDKLGGALSKTKKQQDGLNGAVDKAVKVVTGLDINLQGATKAVRGATIGMKAFKTALITTGIGALIVGLGLLIANWDKLKTALFGTEKQLKSLKEQMDGLASSISLLDAQNKYIESQIELNKLQGKELDNLLLVQKQILEAKLATLEADLLLAEQSAKATRKKSTELSILEKIGFSQFAGKGGKFVTDEEKKEINEAEKATLGFREAINKLRISLINLSKETGKKDPYKNLIVGSAKFFQQQLTDLKLQQASQSVTNEQWEEFEQKIKDVRKQLDFLKNGGEKVTNIPTTTPEQQLATTDAPVGLNLGWTYAVEEETEKVLTELEKLDRDTKKIIEGSVKNTFLSLGQSIGEALASGGNVLESVGKSLLGSLGNFLGELASMLIEYGTMAVLKGKLDLAIIAGGPIAIGAGLAMIAVGVALSAISGAIGSFASSGGQSSSGDVAGSGVSSYSGSRVSSSSVSQGGTYVFEIAGTKLIGVLQNTLKRNKSFGGNITFG